MGRFADGRLRHVMRYSVEWGGTKKGAMRGLAKMPLSAMGVWVDMLRARSSRNLHVAGLHRGR